MIQKLSGRTALSTGATSGGSDRKMTALRFGTASR